MNYISEINLLESNIKSNNKDRDSLFNQTFITWYTLVEESIGDDDIDLRGILRRNLVFINDYYPYDPKFLFLQGWMIQISPWFFQLDNDSSGIKEMRLAYKYEPYNNLFKWALRDVLNLQQGEVAVLKALILVNFEEYLTKYKPVKEYFLAIIN